MLGLGWRSEAKRPNCAEVLPPCDVAIWLRTHTSILIRSIVVKAAVFDASKQKYTSQTNFSFISSAKLSKVSLRSVQLCLKRDRALVRY